MDVSVIIPSYNGEKKIGFLLEALLSQTFREFELIVVIDGSTDGTLNVLKMYESHFKNFKVLSQANGGRSKVRNGGAREAVGNLFIFYDDDMVPLPDSIERHIKIQQQHDGVLLTGHPVEEIAVQKTDVQNYKATRSKLWMQNYADSVNVLDFKNLFFSAANCSIPRNLFEKLGGFDERLVDAEDYALATCALHAGINVLFDKENKAIHREFITARGYLRRLRQYGQAHEKLTELYPDLSSLKSKPSSLLKHGIYRVFAFGVWIKWIDNGTMSMLPSSLRYKFYDIVFHSLLIEFPSVKI